MAAPRDQRQADPLTWKWNRQTMTWLAKTADGYLLRVRVRRIGRRSAWLAEVLSSAVVKLSGQLHPNSDLAQRQCLELLYRARQKMREA
jgi:hypothetical protein